MIPDLAFGAHQPLGDRRILGQESAGDLSHAERRGRDVDVIVGAQTEEIPELRAVLLAVERR